MSETNLFFNCRICKNWYRKEFRMRDSQECVNCHGIADETILTIETLVGQMGLLHKAVRKCRDVIVESVKEDWKKLRRIMR